MSQSRLRALVALCLPTLLSGCLAVAAAGTGSSIGYVVTEDRSLRQNADDIIACTQAIELWVQFKTNLNDDLGCHTYDGRMLVTGIVPTEAWRAEAIKRAWEAKNVKEVYDEITIGQNPGFLSDTHDVLTTQKLRAELLTDPNVHSNNYIITTENRVVYIIGSAHSAAERQRVIDRARTLNGVRRVITYIRINAGTAPSTVGTAGTSPAAAGSQAGAPTPRSDITVTPLH